jgi:excisionase family DNA binding protein
MAERPRDGLLAPDEVARLCGLSRKAVYRAIERGELPASRLCSRLRVRGGDIEAWIEANQIRPTLSAAHLGRPMRPIGTHGLRRLLKGPGGVIP